jgi:outer membrane protein OmpA-like peptidoglycan-associated protein
MAQNPSLQLDIDGPSNARAASVRDALVQAGVPAYKIQMGAVGDPQLRRNDRVEVLISTRS